METEPRNQEWNSTAASAGDTGAGASAAREEAVKWERGVLEKLALAAVKEQRRTRIWNLIFRFLLLAYLVALPLIYMPKDWLGTEEAAPHTALVEVSGVISPGGEASADRIVGALRAAFEDEDTAGVILRINSPGGSPVQAGYVYDEVQRLRRKHPDVPLHAVIADVAASGGYYVASAADQIYADKASMVGSIGVLMNGFGFVEGMEKLGVERRLLTAGENKALLDPFSPLDDEHVEHIQGLLSEIHQQFVDVVKEGRGDRLKDQDELFSGLVWSGERSVELGLVDGLASASKVAREVIKAEKIVDFTTRKSYVEQFADRLGASVARELSLSGPAAGGGAGGTWGWLPQLR